MTGSETQSYAEEQTAIAEADYADMRRMYDATRPLTRLIVMVGAAVRATVLRVVWHIGDIITQLDALRAESTARGVASALQLVELRGALVDALTGVADLTDGTRIAVTEQTDALHADLADIESMTDVVGDRLNTLRLLSESQSGQFATMINSLLLMQPVAPLAPAAGTLPIVALGQPVQLVQAGGRVDRIVFYNTAGAAIEFEVRLGTTRIDHVRITPNASWTVGPFAATAAVMVSGVAGTIANLALCRWSVVYR